MMHNQKFVIIWYFWGTLNAIRGPFDTLEEAEIYKEKLVASYKDESKFEIRLVAK